MKVLANFIYKESSRPLDECSVYQYLIDEKHAKHIGKPFQTIVYSGNKKLIKTIILVSVEPYNQYEIEKYIWRRGSFSTVAVLGRYHICEDEKLISIYNEECETIFNEFKEKRGKLEPLIDGVSIEVGKYKLDDYIDLPFNYNCRCIIKPITKEDEEMEIKTKYEPVNHEVEVKIERKIFINGYSVEKLSLSEILEYAKFVRESIHSQHDSVSFDMKKKDLIDLLTIAKAKAESF